MLFGYSCTANILPFSRSPVSFCSPVSGSMVYSTTVCLSSVWGRTIKVRWDKLLLTDGKSESMNSLTRGREYVIREVWIMLDALRTYSYWVTTWRRRVWRRTATGRCRAVWDTSRCGKSSPATASSACARNSAGHRCRSRRSDWSPATFLPHTAYSSGKDQAHYLDWTEFANRISCEQSYCIGMHAFRAELSSTLECL